MRLFLILIATVLFFMNYSICDYFYPGIDRDSVNEWDNVRHIVYVLIAAVGLSINMFKPDGTEKFVRLLVYGLVFGFMLPSMIDKTLQDDNFHWYDILFYIFAIYGGMKELFPIHHREIGVYVFGPKIYNLFCKPKC